MTTTVTEATTRDSTVPTMRFPWQRLRADRSTSNTVVMLILAVLLAFFTYSTMIQFASEWQPLPAITGGLIVPAPATLLVIVLPTRYRMCGLAMRHWLLDHGLLVALVLVTHLVFPVIAHIRPIAQAEQIPVWTLLLPVVGVGTVVAVMLWRYRNMLTGRLGTTAGTGSATPLYYRVLLARRGPAAWRVVYQPIGLVLGIVLNFTSNVYFDGTSPLWPSLLALGAAALGAWFMVSYARTTSTLGRPSWSVTSLIGGARRAGN